MSSSASVVSIHHMPPEILEQIFANCNIAYINITSKDPFPVLSRVCSSWRHVLAHSPRLWANLSMDLAYLARKDSKQLSFGPADFLKLSKDVSLSIQLNAPFPDLTELPNWKPLLDNIIEHSYRRVRSLTLSTSWISHFLYSFPSDCEFSRLTELSISSSTGPSFDTFATPFTSFSNTPLLRCLTYNAYISYETALNLDIPWEQLTHVTFTDIDYLSWNHIFQRCTNLQSGTFVISGTTQPIQKTNNETIFPHLTHLSIQNEQSSPRSPILLQGHSYPNLQELKLGWKYSPGFDFSFLSTIRDLRKLIICNSPYHSINVLEILHAFRLVPTIKELDLSDDQNCADIFDALTDDVYLGNALLPRLQTLVIKHREWNAMFGEECIPALKKMVGSRWWVYPKSKVARLQRLRVNTTNGDGAEVIRKALNPCTNSGLSLIITTSSVTREDCGVQK